MGKRRLVQAWRRDTGVMVMVPEHWLGHPTLGVDFRETEPKTAAVQVEEPQRPARRKNTDSQGG